MKIKVPEVIWALGDAEQSTASGVTTTTRPIYYKGRRAGSIHTDYVEPLMAKLLIPSPEPAPAEPSAPMWPYAPLPPQLQEKVDAWLKSNRGEAKNFYHGVFPLGMVTNWIERAERAEKKAAPAEPTQDTDIRAIVSSYGFLLMRLAVAKDAQDTFDVCKREFQEHEAALKRLQDTFIHDKPAALPARTPEPPPAPTDRKE